MQDYSTTLTPSDTKEKDISNEKSAISQNTDADHQDNQLKVDQQTGKLIVPEGILSSYSSKEKAEKSLVEIKDLSVAYTPEKKAISDINVIFYEHLVTAVMGPSGCGKSTLLRAVNRMHDLYPAIRTEGQIFLEGKDLMNMPAMDARRRVGMVFQRPNPFPTMSIADNVLAGYKLNGISLSKSERQEVVQTSLESVGLWDEVKDSIKKRGSFLSGGQQQRLCIARTLAMRPQVILMDEPTSALDPIATNRIEELILELKKDYTIIIVTHNMSQAARVSDRSAFMYLGELVEYDDTHKMFTNPDDKRTQDYLTGVFS